MIKVEDPKIYIDPRGVVELIILILDMTKLKKNIRDIKKKPREIRNNLWKNKKL